MIFYMKKQLRNIAMMKLRLKQYKTGGWLTALLPVLLVVAAPLWLASCTDDEDAAWQEDQAGCVELTLLPPDPYVEADGSATRADEYAQWAPGCQLWLTYTFKDATDGVIGTPLQVILTRNDANTGWTGGDHKQFIPKGAASVTVNAEYHAMATVTGEAGDTYDNYGTYDYGYSEATQAITDERQDVGMLLYFRRLTSRVFIDRPASVKITYNSFGGLADHLGLRLCRSFVTTGKACLFIAPYTDVFIDGKSTLLDEDPNLTWRFFDKDDEVKSGQVIEIGSKEELLALAAIKSDFTGVEVRLTQNISLFEERVRFDNFNGTFNGAGHRIFGAMSNDYNGSIFGTIGPKGVIKDLQLEDCWFGSLGQDYSGVLAETNKGVIERCSVKFGNVTADFDVYFGLLVGNNEGTIDQCYVTGNNLDYAPGRGIHLGGLVYKNRGSITACYVRCNVDGDGRSGEFAGIAYDNGTDLSSDGGYISSCYYEGDMRAYFQEGRDHAFTNGYGAEKNVYGTIYCASTFSPMARVEDKLYGMSQAGVPAEGLYAVVAASWSDGWKWKDNGAGSPTLVNNPEK